MLKQILGEHDRDGELPVIVVVTSFEDQRSVGHALVVGQGVLAAA
jgi:hypothetical protein